MLVLVGKSDDGTLDLIQRLDSTKIRIQESEWDDSLREGGRVLAVETDKALAAIGSGFDWCFYLQADEVLHEKFIPQLRKVMEEHRDDENVEGLLFAYRHFYGSYQYLADSRTFYRNEVRIIRNIPGMKSYRDAQGFRRFGKKLKVKKSGAEIFHYGWVKNPHFQQQKQESFHRLWHSDEEVKQHISEADSYDYSRIDSLRHFEGSHPAVMMKRVQNCDWDFHFDVAKKKFQWKDRVLFEIEKQTGIRLFEYRNFRLI
jgi:hypothetical protein